MLFRHVSSSVMNLVKTRRAQLASALLVVASIVVIPTLKADKPSTVARFTSASLEGLYAYTNNTQDVASYGSLIFDGVGHVTSPEIKVNRPDNSGGRSVVTLGAGSGTYFVDPTGRGAVTLSFPTASKTYVYEFVITRATADESEHVLVATEVFSALTSGGLNGQLAAPVWTRVLLP